MLKFFFQMRWDELQREILEFEKCGPVSDEEIEGLTSAQRRKNVSSHIIQATNFFDKRIRAIFNYLKTPRSLGDYHVVDFFYRVEFQQRGITQFCKIML